MKDLNLLSPYYTNWRKLFLWLIYYCHFYFLYKSIMFWGLCVPKIASAVLSLQQKYDEYGDFFFLYLLLPIRAHKSTVMSRNNDQQVRHILKSIILLCASHLSLSSSHRLGFFARTGTATLARPLERLIFNLVVSLVSELF